jgi:hypothetical protein
MAVRRINMIGKNYKFKIPFLILIIAVVVLFTSGTVLAKEAEFRLDIDSLNMQKGVSANLTFSIINANGNKCTDLEIKGLENFEVLSRSQSNSTQIINNDRTTTININYIIMPKSTGSYSLEGSLKYQGDIYKTNVLNINVSEGTNESNEEAEDLFLKTTLSSKEIYFGQKVALTYELYSRYKIEDYGFLDEINIDQFILNDVSKDKLNANYAFINNNKYVKYEARKMYLSPIKTGDFTIPEYNFQANVGTGDFFSSSKPMYLKTDSKELTVKPLPMHNKPVDFDGIVGELNIEATYDKNKMNYGDSLTLKVTASGNCNLDNLSKIIKDDIPGFSVYETEKGLEESIDNNQYNAKKEFEIILVPEKNGELNIDPIYISYFDTKSESYKKAEIPGTTITVTGDVPKDQQQGQKQYNNQETVAIEKVKIEQVNYETDDIDYVNLRIKKKNLIAFLVILIIIVLGIIVFLYTKKNRQKEDSELKEIYKQFRNTDDINEIYNIFNSMIKYRYNISLKASSRSTIRDILEEYNIANEVLDIMHYFEVEKDNRDSKYLKEKINEVYKIIK